MSQDVLAVLADLIRGVFDARNVAIGRDTEAADVEGWDSLSHAILMLRIESHFGVRLPLDQAYDFDNVGALADFIETAALAGSADGKREGSPSATSSGE